jgi:hypothetical protein
LEGDITAIDRPASRHDTASGVNRDGAAAPKSGRGYAPLFTGGSVFFLASDKLQVKYEMLRARLVEGVPVSESAAAQGYSPGSVLSGGGGVRSVGDGGARGRAARPGQAAPGDRGLHLRRRRVGGPASASRSPSGSGCGRTGEPSSGCAAVSGEQGLLAVGRHPTPAGPPAPSRSGWCRGGGLTGYASASSPTRAVLHDAVGCREADVAEVPVGTCDGAAKLSHSGVGMTTCAGCQKRAVAPGRRHPGWMEHHRTRPAPRRSRPSWCSSGDRWSMS